MAQSRSFYVLAIVLFSLATTAFSSANLSTKFYHKSCPKALPTIKRIVEDAVKQERRMGASLLRLHFHDCFVNGCDASILLDQTPAIVSEKGLGANANSARGFEVIDRIKSAVDKACGRPVVSCADILTVAARDSVVALGGPAWKVALGRRDSTKAAGRTMVENDIPSPTMELSELLSSFKKKGLNAKDLVALSGAHTLGFSQCGNFKDHIYNDTNIDPLFARQRRTTCPQNGGDANLAPLDQTAAQFDTRYFSNLVRRRGLFHSDQQLFINGTNGGGETGTLVRRYSVNPEAFMHDFAVSMVKLGNMKPLTGRNGEIRLNCRRVN